MSRPPETRGVAISPQRVIPRQTIGPSIAERMRAGTRRVMATWQRLSYECVARVFAGSLYLRRFAGVGPSRAGGKLVEVCRGPVEIQKGVRFNRTWSKSNHFLPSNVAGIRLCPPNNVKRANSRFSRSWEKR